MNESKKEQPVPLKIQISPRKVQPNSVKPKSTIKRNKKEIILSFSSKEVASLSKNSMKSSNNQTNVNENSKNVNTQKTGNQQIKRSPIKRNHSQVEVSSPILKSQSPNTTKNDDEFEKQIQKIQTDLSPGVAIGHDGKIPASPAFVKHKYKDMLTPYEMSEINEYPSIYFIGNSISKKITKGSFDQDKTFQYNARIGDHIAYRYEIISILGKGAFGTVLKCIDHKTKDKVAIKILINAPVMERQGRIEIDNMRLLSSGVLSTEIKREEHHSPSNKSTQLNQKAKTKRSSSSESTYSTINSNSNVNSTKVSSQPISNSNNSNMKHVVKMIDSFKFRNHTCIVTEILGESLYDFMKRKTKSKPTQLQNSKGNSNSNSNNSVQPKQPEQFEPLPAQMVKLIAFQIMDGLASIHRKKIIHGDLKPENILFTIPTSENSHKQNTSSPKSRPVTSQKKYSYPLTSPYQSPRKIASSFATSHSTTNNFGLKSKVKIIDFGSSCRQGELVFNYIQSRFYRAPEVILGAYYGPGIDVWSAGCIIAELAVGRPLFPATSETDLLVRFIETLGMPPQGVIQMQSDFVSKSQAQKTKTSNSQKSKPSTVNPQKNRFFCDDGRLINVVSQPVPMKTRLSSILKSTDALMIDFLSKCLEWDKNKRMSAAKLCRHPWISSFATQND